MGRPIPPKRPGGNNRADTYPPTCDHQGAPAPARRCARRAGRQQRRRHPRPDVRGRAAAGDHHRAARDRAAGQEDRQRRQGPRCRRRHVRAGQEGPRRGAAEEGRQQVGRRRHRRPGQGRQGRVRRARRLRDEPGHLPRRRAEGLRAGLGRQPRGRHLAVGSGHLHRPVPRHGPERQLGAPDAVLPAVVDAQLLQGRPVGGRGLEGHDAPERAARPGHAGRFVHGVQAGRHGHRQLRLPPQRARVDRRPPVPQVRRRGRPHQVPAAPGPARVPLDAAAGPDVHPQRLRGRRRDRHHRVLRRRGAERRPDQLRLQPDRVGRPAEDRRLDQEAGALPQRQEGRLVQALPRVLGRVVSHGVRLPHRRPRDRAHHAGHLGRAAVPDPQPPELRLRAQEAQGRGQPAADHERGLDPLLAGAGRHPPDRRARSPRRRGVVAGPSGRPPPRPRPDRCSGDPKSSASPRQARVRSGWPRPRGTGRGRLGPTPERRPPGRRPA